MNAHPAWDNFAIFLEVARHGGATGAARSLRVHHATVSRHIAELETQLQVRLFERSTRGMALTSAGEELLAHVGAIEKEIEAIGRKVAGRDHQVQGKIRVATVDDLAVTVVPSLVRDFRRQFPSVEISMNVGTEQSDLARREADVAIRFGNPPEDAGVVRRKIADVSGALYASPDYLGKSTLPKSVDDLHAHEVIRGDESLERLPIELFWDRHGNRNRIAFRSNSMFAQVSAVRAGIGIGWVSYFMLAPGDALQRIPIEVPDMTVGLWMVIHSDMRRVARIRAFADFAWDYLTARRSSFERAP